MSNTIDATGITTKTLTELTAELQAALKVAYGSDINVASDSPDGQMINIFSQAVVDVQDLLVQIYNSFDPDLAIGRVLDQRVAINGIQRLGGTYSVTPVLITVDRSLNLSGLDAEIANPDGTGFTVGDTQGNKFILADSTTISAGAHSLPFRAQNSGAVTTVLNTITSAITIVLGVLSVNNPTTITTLGLDEESDSDLRLRRQKSVSLASQGYLASLLAELLNISGVTYAKVYENITGAADIDGIPSHSIWAIVEGGASSDIAYSIYTKRNAGCGMKGTVIETVTQPDGSIFQISFDRTSTQNLYEKFSAHSIDGITAISTTYLSSQLAALTSMDVNQSVNVNDLATLIREIDVNCLATNIQVSADGSTWLNIVSPTSKNYRFSLSAANINITVV